MPPPAIQACDTLPRNQSCSQGYFIKRQLRAGRQEAKEVPKRLWHEQVDGSCHEIHRKEKRQSWTLAWENLNG